MSDTLSSSNLGHEFLTNLFPQSQCSICCYESSNVFECQCGIIMCDKCIAKMIKDKNSFNIYCSCKKKIQLYEFVKLFSSYKLYKLLDRILSEKAYSFIVDTARNLYPVFSDIQSAAESNEEYAELLEPAYKIICGADDLPLPDQILYDLPDFDLKPKQSFSSDNFSQFIQVLLNYHELDIDYYNKLRKNYLPRMQSYISANLTPRYYTLVESYVNTHKEPEQHNDVIAKCKYCRYGLIIKIEDSLNKFKIGSQTSSKVSKIHDESSKIEYKCNACSKIYCPNCLELAGENHKCSQSDLLTWNELKTHSVPCPCCGTRIYKVSGCNEMFCTNCHNNFNFATGKVINGNIHNPHRIEWLNRNTHYTNTDISEIERYASLKFNRLLFYHNDLMGKYLNYQVQRNRNSDNVIKLVMAYYNDIECKHDYEKILPWRYNLSDYVSEYLGNRTEIFKSDVVHAIYGEICDCIYNNLLKIINSPDTYVSPHGLNQKADQLYDEIIAKLSAFEDLMYKCEHEFKIYNFEHFLFKPLPIPNYDNIVSVDLNKIGLDNIDDLYDILEDLNNSNKIYDQSELNKYCDYNDPSINDAFLSFLRRFKFPRDNIKHSYYLSRAMINRLC